jgi:hypothetical protein
MSLENDFLPFAVGSGAAVISQATYAANATLLANGFQVGIADENTVNKVWRQSSIISSVIGQLINAQAAQPAIDDGTTATLLANLLLAIQNIAAGVSVNEATIATTGGTTVLSSTQLGAKYLLVTGVLTSNAALTFPAAVGTWKIINTTTGAFTLTAQTASGGSVLIAQGHTDTITCDGTNIVYDLADAATAPIGDSSTAIVNTAFLARALSDIGGYYLDTGVANAYVITTVPPTTAYTNGMSFRFKVAHANTGASTLNAGGGVKAMVRDDGAALQPGDLPVSTLVSVVYDTPTTSWVVGSIVYSQFGTAARLNASDQLGGVSSVQVYAGNPNGHVAGNAAAGAVPPSSCWDSTDGILYTCTTTGTTSTAVWIAPVAATASSLSGGVAGNSVYQSAIGVTSYVTNAAGVLQAVTSGSVPAWTLAPTLTGTNFSGTAGSLTAGTANALTAANSYTVAGLTVSGTGQPINVNSTSSTPNKIGFQDAGTQRGYIGSSAAYAFIAYNAAGSTQILTVDNSGDAVVTGTLTSTDFIGAGTGLTGTAGSLTAGVANALTAANTYTAAAFLASGSAYNITSVSGSGSTWYKTYFGNDGASWTYLLNSPVQTSQAAANAVSGFSTPRPLMVNLSTGVVQIDSTGNGTTIGGTGAGTGSDIRGLNYYGGEISWQNVIGSPNMNLDISDTAGSNGGSYSFTIRGLATGGTAGINLSAINLNAVSTVAAGTFTPNGGIVGITSGAAAPAGTIGQVVTATGTSVSISTTATAVASIPLTAGRWEVQGNITATSTTILTAGLNSSSAMPSAGNEVNATASSAAGIGVVCPSTYVNISSSSTYYLMGQTSGTTTATGTIWAIRVS